MITTGSSRQLLPALLYLLHPCSRIQAMILTAPPHSLQVSISILNTRFNRLAQVIDTRRSAGVCSGVSSGVRIFLPWPRRAGVTRARYLPVRFRWVKAPSCDELTQLTHTIAHRVARYLERQGWLVRDAGNSYLTADGVDTDPESPINQLLGS